jgi:regulatory protein
VVDPRQRALERALKSISVRERTQAEVGDFLRRRGYEGDVIDDVVRSLCEEGLVDDAGYARRFAEDRRLLDRWGNERIARDLERRGIERELVDQALAGHGKDDELVVAIELLDRRFPQPFDGDRERDKAWRMLVRRGYEPELAYSAIRRHEQGLRRDAA